MSGKRPFATCHDYDYSSLLTDKNAAGVTISTTYEPPYHLARRLSTVDHLTDGRLGWNVVTGYLDSAARNLSNGADNLGHDERYEMCEEYMEVPVPSSQL